MKKRKRAYRRKSAGGGGAQQLQPSSLPPNVIYQSNQITPIPYQFTPEPAPKITEPAPKPKTILEDVGVGTEGFVKILDLPTKKEQLESMTAPVKLKSPANIGLGEYADTGMVKSTPSRPLSESEGDIPPQFMAPSAPSITQKINEPSVELKGREEGVPAFDFGKYQPVEEPLKSGKVADMVAKLNARTDKIDAENKSGYASGFEKGKGKSISTSWFKLTDELNRVTGSDLTPEQAKYAYKNLKNLRGTIQLAKQK